MNKKKLAGNGNAKTEAGLHGLQCVAEVKKNGCGAKSHKGSVSISLRRLLMLMAAIMMAMVAFSCLEDDEAKGDEDENGGGGGYREKIENNGADHRPN